MIYKTIYIYIIGSSNVGKSTICNLILKKNISLINCKIHFTRTLIYCVILLRYLQFVIIDTPGYNSLPTFYLEKFISNNIYFNKYFNYLCLVIDISSYNIFNSFFIIKKFFFFNQYIIFFFNKSDLLIDNLFLIEISLFLIKKGFFNIFITSLYSFLSIYNILCFFLRNCKIKYLFYNIFFVFCFSIKKVVEDISLGFLYNFFHQELPYNLFIFTDSWNHSKDFLIIYHTIVVSKNTHRTIIFNYFNNYLKKNINNNNNNNNLIFDISKFFNRKVFLYFFVKNIDNF